MIGGKLVFVTFLFCIPVFFILGCKDAQIFQIEPELKSDVPDNIGVLNALKKAAQMRNVAWKTTAEGMPYNDGVFAAFTEYRGIPYSNVLAYNQHVFFDVSLETFITAVHNPRSVLYTENVSGLNSKSSLGRHYNGIGCACYYGTTCSYLIVYSLGLPFGILASEFPFWDDMETISNQSYSGVKLADVLSSGKHVALITDIIRDKKGDIQTITVTENAWRTTSSKEYTPAQFDDFLSSGYTILRYKYIENNIQYTPMTDFVAVSGEMPKSYLFNEDICPNYGNKSNYIEGDDVVLNITNDYKEKGYTYLMVYKDEKFLYRLNISSTDIVLRGLSYGDYRVCLTNGTNNASMSSFFKVVNMSVSLDNSSGDEVVYFASKNAKPVYYDFCEENGQKGPSGVKGLLSHLLTLDEIAEGRAILSPPLITTEDAPYIKVHFETEYGRTVKAVKNNLLSHKSNHN